MTENWVADLQKFFDPISVPVGLRFDGRRFAQVRRLFKKYDFDPEDLRDWHLLLRELAGKPIGRPSKWRDQAALFGLRLRFDLVKRAFPDKDDSECLKELKKRLRKSNGAYSDLKITSLQRRLRDARKAELASSYRNFKAMILRSPRERGGLL